MQNRRQILKTTTASVLSCFLPPAIQNTGLLSAGVFEDDDDAFYAARNLHWSKEVENVWLELLGTGLKSLRPDVPSEDMREAIGEWLSKCEKSLEEGSFFRMEVSNFEPKKPMVAGFVAAIRKEKTAEEKAIHCLDLIRLISPIHHYQQGDEASRDAPMTVVEKLTRLKRYHPGTFRHLAEATISLDDEKLRSGLDEWSGQLAVDKRQDVLLQMYEGLDLLRSEPLIA